MTRLLRKIRLIGAACVLAGGLGVGVSVATAAPADAAGYCFDIAIAQPTPVHIYPWDTSATVEFLNYGAEVTGLCSFLDNLTENRWYMEVNYGGGYAYIWVQRLAYGSMHDCDQGGYLYSIGSGQCPLLPTRTGS